MHSHTIHKLIDTTRCSLCFTSLIAKTHLSLTENLDFAPASGPIIFQNPARPEPDPTRKVRARLTTLGYARVGQTTARETILCGPRALINSYRRLNQNFFLCSSLIFSRKQRTFFALPISAALGFKFFSYGPYE